MSTARRLPRPFLSLAPAVALAAFGLVVAPAPRASATSTGHITHYFNDAAHDVEVGSLVTCPTFSHLTGKQSFFTTQVTINCP